MRVLLRAVLVFSVIGLTAASGRTDDGTGGGLGDDDIQGTGNKIVFDTGSPVSNGVGKLKGSGVATKGSAAWKCDTVTIEILDANNMDKVATSFSKAASPAWSFALEGLDPGTYKVRVKGTFVNGTQSDPKEVISGSIIVQ